MLVREIFVSGKRRWPSETTGRSRICGQSKQSAMQSEYDKALYEEIDLDTTIVKLC